MRLLPGRTLLGEVLWAPWSIVAYGLTLAWMGVLAITSMLIVPFIPFHRFQAAYPQPYVSWALWFAFSPLRVHYDRRHDPRRICVFAHNHVSMLDANVACGSIKQSMCGLENAAHLNVPGYGWLLRLGNAIPVPSGENRYQVIADAVRERVSRGISILTFPEGHRTLDGKIRKFKRGIFMMARDVGLPIVPIVSRGMYRLLPKGTFVIRPSLVEVYVAPHVEMAGRSDEEVLDIMERVHEVMTAWVERREMRGDLLAELNERPS